MKKFTTVILILSSIFIMGCSNKNTRSINDLSDAYLYLSEISSHTPKINFENLKSNLSKFEYKKEDEQKVAIYNPNEDVSHSFHTFSNSVNNLNLVLDDTNNTLVSSKITKTDNNNTLSFTYITDYQVVELLQNLKDSYLLKIESENKDLNKQKVILEYINKYIDKQYFNQYLDISSKLSSSEKLSISDIEKIMNSKYTDTSVFEENGETQTSYVFESNSSQLGVFFNEDGLCFKVYINSYTDYNQEQLINNPNFRNNMFNISFDKNKSLASIKFYIADKKENLSQINIKFFNSIFK